MAAILDGTSVANSIGGSDLSTSSPGTFTGDNNLIDDGGLCGLSPSNGNITGDPNLSLLGWYGGG